MEGKDRSSTIILVSPVISSLLSNLTSSGWEGAEILLPIALLAGGFIGGWFEITVPLLDEGSSPLIKRWAWILPVAPFTETIAVAAEEVPPIILNKSHFCL